MTEKIRPIDKEEIDKTINNSNKKYKLKGDSIQKYNQWSYKEFQSLTSRVNKCILQYTYKIGDNYITQSIWLNQLYRNETLYDLQVLLERILK